MLKKYFQPLNVFLFTLFAIHFVAVPNFLSSFAALGLLILIGQYLYRMVREKKLVIRSSIYLWLLLALVIASAFSALDAYIPSQAWGAFANNLGILILLAVLLPWIQAKKDLQQSIKVLYAGFVVILLFGVYQYLAANGYIIKIPLINFVVSEAKYLHRISSLFIVQSGTSAFSAYISFMVPAVVTMFLLNFKLTKNNFWKIILVAALILFNVFFSLSRAMLLSFIFVLAVAVLNSRYREKFIILALAIFIVLISFVTPFRKTFVSIFDTGNLSNRDHLESYVVSLMNFAKHPINGWGGGHINWKLIKQDGKWQSARGLYHDRIGRLPKKLAFELFPYLEENYHHFYHDSRRFITPKIKDPAALEQKILEVAPDKELADRLKNFFAEEKYFRHWEDVSVMQLNRDAAAMGVLYLNSPHNIYLYYALEYGIIGLIILLAIFGVSLQRLRRISLTAQDRYLRTLSKSMLYGLISFMFYGLLHDSLATSIIAAFFLVTLTLIQSINDLAKTN